jgi:hypothetical protein
MEAVEAGTVDAVRLLVAAGARVDYTDPFGAQAIVAAEDLAIVRLLLAHGADLNAVSDEMRRALFGIADDDALDLPWAAYAAGKARRFGAANPEAMAVPFWQAMVRSRAAASTARRRFNDTPSCGDGAVWCFQRFGRTLTALPDGRYVEIGGEHEDFYDPDFCIYNDVVVYDGAGEFTLYGYPAAVFPPTDFHTATLVGDSIYLIGSLGYAGQRRYGETPVYRVSWQSWQIERVETHGRSPGWISRHTAVYDAARQQIVVAGGKRCVRRTRAGRGPGQGHLRWFRRRAGGGARSYRERYLDSPGSYALELATMTWRQLRG